MSLREDIRITLEMDGWENPNANPLTKKLLKALRNISTAKLSKNELFIAKLHYPYTLKQCQELDRVKPRK